MNMILIIFLIIFVISIDGITTKNSSILISSCQGNNNRLESSKQSIEIR
jgi:hypothetical protein